MRTPQQALKDAIDSGAVQAWIEGKPIQYKIFNSSEDWDKVSETWKGYFNNTAYVWRVAPPEPPKPTIVDWQPIETCPKNTRILLRFSDNSMGDFTGPAERATHWAPMPAPPQGDK